MDIETDGQGVEDEKGPPGLHGIAVSSLLPEPPSSNRGVWGYHSSSGGEYESEQCRTWFRAERG